MEALITVQGSTTAKSYDSVCRAANDYLPLINQILLSCQVQPEFARLDERLIFQWASGVEKNKTFFKSEALVYDLVMTLVCDAMACIGLACDASDAADYALAGRNFKKAASIFQFLAKDQLPKWVATGTVNVDQLPSEATVGFCEAFTTYLLAAGQQMAVATTLCKGGTPNYTLVAKLCLGIAEQIDTFTGNMRAKANIQMMRMDQTFFSLETFQMGLELGLSMYFMARSYWEKGEYGVALSAINEAQDAIINLEGSVSSKGMSALASYNKTLKQDISTLKDHMKELRTSWEYDNNKIYFESVPRSVPENKKLPKGLDMMKTDPYELPNVDPVPLGLPVKDNQSIFKTLGGIFKSR